MAKKPDPIILFFSNWCSFSVGRSAWIWPTLLQGGGGGGGGWGGGWGVGGNPSTNIYIPWSSWWYRLGCHTPMILNYTRLCCCTEWNDYSSLCYLAKALLGMLHQLVFIFWLMFLCMFIYINDYLIFLTQIFSSNIQLKYSEVYLFTRFSLWWWNRFSQRLTDANEILFLILSATSLLYSMIAQLCLNLALFIR